jgi:pantetheine-phosphate adenylyltransferase
VTLLIDIKITSMTEKIALYPGSFDPVTFGHVDVIKRAAAIFDVVYVGVGNNTTKSYLFDLDTRIELVKKVFDRQFNIRVEGYQELTVQFGKKIKANYIIRGLRTYTDFEYEKSIAEMNKILDPDAETIFLISRPEFSSINSTIVREIIRNKGDISGFVPEEVLSFMNKNPL